MLPRSEHGARILSNTGWLLLAETLGRLLTFLAIMRLARALTPTDLGMVELGLSSYHLLSLVALGGIEVLALRRVARTPAGLGRIAAVHAAIGWLWVFPSLILVIVLATLLDRPAPTATIIGGFAAVALLVPLSMRFAFQGRERMGWLAVGSVLGQSVWTAGVLTFVHEGDAPQRLPWLHLAAEAVQITFLLAAFWHLFGPVHLPRPRQLRAWAAASVPISIGRIARGLLYFIDVLLLGLFVPLSDVGLYAVALRLPLFGVTAAARMQQAVFPRVAQLAAAHDVAAQGALLRRCVVAAMSLGVAAAVTLGDAGGAYLGVLFGDRFREGAPLLAILCWKIPLSALAGLLRNLVWAVDPRLDARLAVFATGAAVAAMSVGAWMFGAAGCAMGMVFGEVLSCALYGWVSRRSVRWPHRAPWPLLTSFLVSAVVLATWIGRPWSLHDAGTMLGALSVGAVAGAIPLLTLWRQRTGV